MNPRIEQIFQFLKEDPNDSFMNYALALEYIKESDLDLAVSQLYKTIELDPNYVAAYYQLGKVYESTGQMIKASEAYLKGMDLTKNDTNRKTYFEFKEAYNLLVEEDN